ncbi:MAG: SH3 domain-containing protein [Candidatus Omnitrophica bacterium]|nr:SH3 domain-containing protein [Candidatus Omnitrophota bacterium]
MKKFILGACILFCCFGLCRADDYPECLGLAKPQYLNAYTGIIAADSVNIRSGPGVTFEILCQLDKDDLVLVLEEKETPPWYKIRLPRHSKAFVHKEFAQMDKDGLYATITADSVNIRAEQGTNFNILGQLNKKEVVELISVNGDWYQIYPLTNETVSAWVNKKYVKKKSGKDLYLEQDEKFQKAYNLLHQARIFEEDLEDIKSALEKYEIIAQDLPESPQAKIALARIEILKLQVEAEEKEKEEQEKELALAALPLAQGKIIKMGKFWRDKGTHKLIQNGKTVYFLKSDTVNLNDFLDLSVQIWGKIIKPGKISTIEVEQIELN